MLCSDTHKTSKQIKAFAQINTEDYGHTSALVRCVLSLRLNQQAPFSDAAGSLLSVKQLSNHDRAAYLGSFAPPPPPHTHPRSHTHTHTHIHTCWLKAQFRKKESKRLSATPVMWTQHLQLFNLSLQLFHCMLASWGKIEQIQPVTFKTSVTHELHTWGNQESKTTLSSSVKIIADSLSSFLSYKNNIGYDAVIWILCFTSRTMTVIKQFQTAGPCHTLLKLTTDKNIKRKNTTKQTPER